MHRSSECYLLIVSLFLMVSQLTAQEGIGTSNPNLSAALDIVSKDKGLLIPRVSLTSSSTFAPILGTADQTHNGMLVYNTATTTLYGEGFYYWDWDKNRGSGLWRRLATSREMTNMGIPHLIQDEDEDTRVAVDKNPGTDTDEISFTISGKQQFRMVGGYRLEPLGDKGILIGKKTIDRNNSIFIGNRAGIDNIGESSIGIGTQALEGGGIYNVAIGNFALASNTIGRGNSALGNYALNSNTTGSSNSAFGYYALKENTEGSRNLAFGASALTRNTTGSYNVAVGDGTLSSNTTGSYNVAVGRFAMTHNTTGSSNSALGYYALNKNTTGEHNLALGIRALSSNTTGKFNVAVGISAGHGITTGSRNTIIGSNVNVPRDLSNTVIIADGAGNRRIVVDPIGNVGIKSNLMTHRYTLTVNGSIGLEGGASGLHPDYVFESYYDGVSEYNKDYELMTLEEVEAFVKSNKHLPGVQSRADIERDNGWNVSENVRVNLEKIEELYLYVIEQEKKLDKQQRLIEELLLRFENN